MTLPDLRWMMGLPLLPGTKGGVDLDAVGADADDAAGDGVDDSPTLGVAEDDDFVADAGIGTRRPA